MTLLVFVWTLGGVGAIVAFATSLLTLAVPWSDTVAPARRADAAWMMGAAPAVTSGLVMLATAVPGLRALTRASADHCAGHAHHAHLCWEHGPSTLHAVALFGGLWWAALVISAAQWMYDAVRSAQLALALESIGAPVPGRDLGVVRVPTSTPLCHAVGLLRPRVLISDRVWDALPDDERGAVIAHELAHLRRRDPAAASGLALLSLAAWPGAAQRWRDRWRAAAEEAADADGADATDPTTLAAALVRVARLHLADAPGLAATPHALDARVARLLDGPAPAARSRLVQHMAVVAAVAVALALGAADPVHDVVEDAVSAVTHAVAASYYLQ
jgi:hypothetical protein